MTYRVVLVSDLHCGSIFGLLPDKFKQSDDSIKALNPGQRFLLEVWEHALLMISKIKPNVIIVNGDVIDGLQQAQRGSELALPLIFDQRGAAIELLKPLVKYAPIYFVQGTEYHDSKAGNAVESVAEDLHAIRYSGLGTGKFSKEVLDLDMDGVVLNVAHGISVATGFYRATPLDREGIWSALAGKEGKSPKADAVIRAHAHNFVHVEHPSKHIIQMPCFELQTRYMRKNSVYRMVPDIGFIWLEVDPKEKEHGADPITVHKQLYPLPKVPVARFTQGSK
jgi:predicted MPP superfamily phosphohydrolase